MPKRKVAFEKWTIEDVQELLNCALDDGEWHTPRISDIRIHTHNGYSIYGYCNISQHNTYQDIEHWFNINCSSVMIWKEEYVRNRANISHYKPIHNIQQLVEKLKKHEIVPI